MARPKLLLADDSVTIRKVVELTFADEGIDVTTAADAETAMQKFVEVQPDIVLVDTGLPGTTGYQICDMIKQDDATKHIPVLLLVGSFEPFDQDEAERVSSDGFLTKPFHSIRDLVSRVWDLLGSETPVEETAAVTTTPHAADVADIEHLYDSSFANTAEIEEFDTVDDLLGDTGMDDELIEASSLSLNGSEAPTADFSIPDDPGSTTEFDWSPEALVVENENEGHDIPAHEQEYGDDISLHETVADDPTGGAWRLDEEPSRVLDPAVSESYPESQPIPDELGFDENDAARVNPDGDAGPEEAQYPAAESYDSGEPPVIEANSPFAEVVEPRAFEPEQPSGETTSTNEPSPELIVLVAQRVIDHLSDNVVRDIAKEAVPRIAEKLIREALDQEAKKK